MQLFHPFGTLSCLPKSYNDAFEFIEVMYRILLDCVFLDMMYIGHPFDWSASPGKIVDQPQYIMWPLMCMSLV